MALLTRHERFRNVISALSYAGTLWFIGLATVHSFSAIYIVGLLVLIAGLEVALAMSVCRLWPLCVFFLTMVPLSIMACVLTIGPGVTQAIFAASLICISLITLLIAGARLQFRRRFYASEERFRAVVEQAADGIYPIDARTRQELTSVVQDVSLRRQHEAILLEAKDEAQEIAHFKSALLANVSHEIRTPLSSILGWAAVLSDELDEPQRELVKQIEESGRRLHHTLDSVLELAHLHSNTKRLQPVTIDLAKEVSAIANYMKAHAERKGLSLSVALPQDPLWVISDVSCLRRVVNHVIDNAIKFTERGHVEIGARKAADRIEICVNDTGIGISEGFLPFVFDDFKQESVGLTRHHQGCGLGLSIARRLIELLDGEILVESRRGDGSTFRILIPAGPCPDTDVRPHAARDWQRENQMA